MRSTITWMLAWCVVATSAAFAQPLQSNHGVLRAVPVANPVGVDGKLDEWDTSAEMFSYGVRKLRERYSVRVAAMWDAQALYLGLRWRDPTPMINNVDVDASPGDGWMADSFQARFLVGGRQVHLTTCYSSKKDKSAAVIEYDAALNPAGRRVFVTSGKVTRDASGFSQAFAADADLRGYIQELRIPWNLLDREGKMIQPGGGAKIGFTGEYFWGGASGTTWPAVMWSDPINQKNPVRIVVYQNPGIWGELELLAQGNLPRAAAEESDERLQGPIKLRVAVPVDATKFSLVINDANGRRVRNLAAHANVADYKVGWDSVPTSRARDDAREPAKKVGTESQPTLLEVPWDGRPDGEWNKDRMLFVGQEVVAPGAYTLRGIAHRGVGVTFAGSFYNPGTPPWPTGDGKGGWGFDHSNPQAVAAVPKESKSRGRVFLGWAHGEGGVGFIGLDADGRKLWEWLRRGAGATHIAATANHVFFTFHGEGHRLGQVNPDNGEQVPFGNGTLDVVLPGEPTGLAVRDPHFLAVSIAKKNVVQIFDPATGAKQREITIESPGSLTILPNGELLGAVWHDAPRREDSRRGASHQSLFHIPAGSNVAQQMKTTSEPLAVASDSAGRVLLSDATRSVVELFPGVPINVTGQVPQIGEAGGHVPGPWNPQRIGNPTSIAIEERADGGARLWVAENQLSPRRVSVWDVGSRTLVRDYLGNTRYSASGGFLSDDLPGVGFVDGVRFQIDLARGDARPTELLGGSPAPLAGKAGLFMLGKGAGSFANPYHFVSSASGAEREYLVEAGGTQPMVFVKRGDRWRCVSALGSATQPFPAEITKAPTPTSVFSWHDLNDDGYQQPDEFTWHDLGVKNVFQCGWGYRCGRDLTFYHSGFAFRPVKFADDGAPIYDVSKAERLPGQLGNVKGDIRRTRFGYFASLSSGHDVDKHNVIHGLHQLAGFDDSGRLRWTYPNYWVAVHGAFTAPMAMPGVLMGVLKTSGVIEPANPRDAASTISRNALASGSEGQQTIEPDASAFRLMSQHSIISLRGNIGQEFLIRDDGVYLGELFTDQRMAPADLPATRDIVGVPINETTLGGEPFNGWIGRQRDGKVRMTFGATDVRIAEVVGLDRVTDLAPQTVTLGDAEIASAKSFMPKVGSTPRRTQHEIARGGAFTSAELTDSKFFDDSPDVLIIRSGREEVGRARLRWDESALHLACQVADTTPFVNKGVSAPLAFKTGDCVSLFLASESVAKDNAIAGARVLLAAPRGKPTAVVYRPQGPGNAPFVFESPVRKSPFAFVAEDASIKFNVTPGNGSYTLTASVPWSVLAVAPQPGAIFRADLGLLFADDSGANTAQRVHWVDRETNVVNDTPTEAEFVPARWGKFLLK